MLEEIGVVSALGERVRMGLARVRQGNAFGGIANSKKIEADPGLRVYTEEKVYLDLADLLSFLILIYVWLKLLSA